jgi:flagellar assembly protein FliH
MSEAARDFVAGLSARHDDAAVRLRRVFDDRPLGFAPADLIARIERAFGGEPFAPEEPRHYAPEDRDVDPTEGWDPLDPTQPADAHLDPVAEARQAGYDAGYAAARHEQDEAAARDRALLSQLVEALGSDTRIDRERIARRLRQTVLHLVAHLVGEVGISGDLLAGRVEAAADLLADAAESAMLRVNPADVALLEGKLPQTIFAVGDASVARGSFVLEAASTIVEDGPDLWLEQLAHALDKVVVPE